MDGPGNHFLAGAGFTQKQHIGHFGRDLNHQTAQTGNSAARTHKHLLKVNSGLGYSFSGGGSGHESIALWVLTTVSTNSTELNRVVRGVSVI